jgi:hypothetical protein
MSGNRKLITIFEKKMDFWNMGTDGLEIYTFYHYPTGFPLNPVPIIPKKLLFLPSPYEI